MRILVIGAQGQIARSLREAASEDGRIVLACTTRPEVDLLRPDSVWPAVRDFRPDIVVNPAAYTAVDQAETEPDEAFAINREGARAIAAAAAALDAPIIHLSTDYVFSGDKPGEYSECDLPAPQSVYGRSKLEGERSVAEANPRSMVLRTAWLYSPFGTNLVRTVLRKAGEPERLRVVNDQTSCPTYAPDVAAAILSMADRICRGGWLDAYAGVTHVAGRDALSRLEFARAIVAGSVLRGGPDKPIDSITTGEFPALARRPANSRLATARLEQVFQTRLPPLQVSLSNCLDRLIGEAVKTPGGVS